MPDLIVKEIVKDFPTRSGALEVLKGISFELSAGENLAILGPSGCGKSTLLHILGTLDRPTSGTMTLAGQNPFELAEPELADFRNHQIGFIFQDHHLLPQCSVLENVLVPVLAGGAATEAQSNRAKELLDRVGLADRLEHRPAELSGGEKQRVAVARSLILQPLLLLADEPTGNLDRNTAATVSDLLLELQKQENTMMIMVTHNIELSQKLERRSELADGLLHELAETSG